jgi:predicted  nucleic acid-binding Zn-ribbon protein
MARLIDDQLQDLTAQHEQEIKALERNMDVYKKQSQELEANLEEERQQHQAHVSQIEEEMQTQRPKEEHIRRLEAEKFQSQLSKVRHGLPLLLLPSHMSSF